MTQNRTPKTADQIKQRVQRIVVSCSMLLLVGKFGAYFLTNSVGILTDAMESIVNVVAGLVSLYGLYLAAKPKDQGHPFGHGKIEFLSASIEGLLILLAGGLIIYEGVIRLFNPTQLQSLDVGIWIIAGAGVVNSLLGGYSLRMGKKHNSMALTASGKHLMSDVYSTIGLVVGLVLLYYTKMQWIDSALALIFGGIIVVTGAGILRKAAGVLMDAADDTNLTRIMQIVTDNHQADWVEIHNLKIIKYGSTYYLDCDLTLPWFYNINQGHDASKELQAVICRDFSDRIFFSIHFDPCREKHCAHCEISDCPTRQCPYESHIIFTLKNLTKSEELNQE